jgi:hypothetical protein
MSTGSAADKFGDAAVCVPRPEAARRAACKERAMSCRRIPMLLAALWGCVCFCTVFPFETRAGEAHYVGSKVCAGCHPDQYAAFAKYSKKAHSSKSVRLMAKGLTPEELTGCYGCHTTGYGKPGGFTSFADTPQLADAGCEVCHGPGSAHTESSDPAAIKGKLTIADCEGCHNASRVRAFGYKPLLRAGAH